MAATRAKDLRRRIRAYGKSLPGAYVDHPWGESVLKVNKKVFLFLGMDRTDDPGLGVKLVMSQPMALAQSGVEAMGYNLGRSGWIWLKLREARLPDDVLRDWVLESYRAVAPRKLVAELDADARGITAR
jgi:predicted DNA-binding protein (MmcQ/YjbR family)